MKKVFAFLSTLLLTIAFVGIFAVSKPAVAANKITEDPTLAEDEIPVYIMNSIYSTFPNYYDNDAKEDANWPGPARMYPWNETRMRVAQFGADGEPTGKYYAVYFSGHTTAVNADGSPVIGAGKNILFWNVDANGAVIAQKSSDGKLTSGGQASDPSLSHMRSNVSGQDITVDPTTLGIGDEGTNFYNRSIVFDAEGRIIRAIGLDDIYTAAAGDYKMLPEYCYVDGVVTKMDENTVCDKKLVAEVDEEGNPVMDPVTGEPSMVEGEEDNIIYSRFVYEYFDEAPTNVNTAPYLGEGWDAMLWDYVYPEGEGYIAIAFVGSADNTKHKVKGDQIAAYEATLKARYIAAGETEEAAAQKATDEANNSFRECVRELRIPAGGWTFDYGYLDKGTGNDVFFHDTVINGYKHGREQVTEVVEKDAEGNEVKTPVYMGAQRTYDFSVSGLFFREKVIDGASYQLMAGQNVVEVMQGTEFKPAQNIVYDGVMRYWGVKNDLTSYTSSSEALEFYVTESKNGGANMTVVQPPQGYTSLEQIRDEFLAACAAHKGVAVEAIKFDTAANFQSNWSWGSFFATNADNGAKPDYPSAEEPAFWNVPENRENWIWLIEQIYATMLAYPGGDTYTASLSHVKSAIDGNYCGSPQTIAYAIWYFLSGQAHTYFGFNFSDADGNGTPDSGEWIDSTSSLEKWNNYTIDATMSAPNDNWVVNYKVVNSATNVSSDITIKYVVVDSYTPIIKVDQNKLFYTPKVIADLVSCDPIDAYSIVKAYDAQYNGVDILGNDISQNIEFDTQLNFANPKEGIWPVVATIYNNAGTKKAVAKFNVEVKDITAPNAVVRKVVIQQGEDFDPRAGIVLAVDNVDGDLSKQAYTWWEETSKPVDTSKDLGGKNATYNVKVSLFDKAGNENQVSYTLVVVADKYTADVAKDIETLIEEVEALEESLGDILTAQDDLQGKIEDLEAILAGLTDVNTEVAELKELVGALKTESLTKFEEVNTALNANKDTVENIAKDVDAIEEEIDSIATSVEGLASGCKKNGTALVLQIAGAAALLALVLRKKH